MLPHGYTQGKRLCVSGSDRGRSELHSTHRQVLHGCRMQCVRHYITHHCRRRRSLEGATVTICRNGDCADATLIPSTLAAGVLVDDFSVNGDTSPRNCVVESAGTDKVSIRLSYRLNADDAPQDGDSYTFQLTPKDSPSTMLVDVQGAVTYAVTQPNGPTCEPTCYNASL